MSPLAWYFLALLAFTIVGIIGGVCYVIEKIVGKIKRALKGLKEENRLQNIGGKR